jgi:hypothetical protein
MVAKDGRAAQDVSQRIRKANGAFIQLYLLWKNSRISTRTELRIFRSNVKSVLLYGSETRKEMETSPQSCRPSLTVAYEESRASICRK